MLHTITMKNTQTDWNEALPQGNGVLGAMSYFRHNRLCCAVNHYEVYYTMYERYSQAYQKKLKEGKLSFGEARSYEELMAAARESIRDLSREPYLNYQRVIWPQTAQKRRPNSQQGVSHPPTGEVWVQLDDALEKPDQSCLQLDIEGAVVSLDVNREEDCVHLEQRVLTDADGVLFEVKQSRGGLVKGLRLVYPQRRNHRTIDPQTAGNGEFDFSQQGYTYSFEQKDESTFGYTVSFYPQREDTQTYEPFTFSGCLKLQGACGRMEVSDNEMQLVLTQAAPEFSAVFTVFTELSGKKTLSGAQALAQKVLERREAHKKAHAQHWKEFFSKSSITLEDPFAETLWFYNLYLLECCSGRGGKRREQACGLNGLWDIKQPTIWGSLWYWDVNIEAAFWPVYTANHMELAQAFNDGLLSYLDAAKTRAEQFYHMPGAAMDYPHVFYNCMWPWCAQFIWWYYEYTLDKTFLRRKAYPLFLDILKFAKAFSRVDEATGRIVIFPDVSPEQGPLTQNSVITIASLRYLCQAALKSAKILEIPEGETDWIADFLFRLPEYPTAQFQNYGEIWKDSELAPAGIHLRHPSVLMPIFPAGEIGLDSPPEQQQLARRTLNFAEDHTELGVFGFGWLSSAASRLGMGDTALRLLYEKGWDLILRDNGMGAEETERFINHCCVTHTPLYYPFMMECIGEGANAVNEMLLQSYNGIIRVFPAIPKGEPELLHTAGRLIQDNPVNYGAWNTASFTGLLAKGGFVVSASLQKGKTASIRIESQFGNFCRIAADCLPQEFSVVSEDGQEIFSSVSGNVLSFPTSAGESYWIRGSMDPVPQPQPGPVPQPLVHVAHTNRRIFLGKDGDTDYIKALDSFLWDYYVANDRRRRMTAYRFSLGCNSDPTQEISMRTPAGSVDAQIAFECIPITPQTRFVRELGYGFRREDTLEAVDSAGVDALRRDSITGGSQAHFLMELPKGRYDVLVVCGSAVKESDITIQSPQNVFAPVSRTLKAGEFDAVTLPLVHQEDGVLELAFTTRGTWSVSAIFLNKDFAM